MSLCTVLLQPLPWYGSDVYKRQDLHSPVGQLSIGMQQKVEILKLLYTGADVLIFDEPTAVLLPQECDGLFEIIANLTSEGKGVIFISHKLDEVLKISRRITVLTKGRVTGQIDTKDADKSTIVRMMVGEEVTPPEFSKIRKMCIRDRCHAHAGGLRLPCLQPL